MDIKERFLQKVRKHRSGCHVWQSTMRKDGYGHFWRDGSIQKAHRVAWEIFIGSVPEGLHVLHKCDNRKCVNLKHLYLGTPSDNVRDKVERHTGMWGRMKVPFWKVKKARRLVAVGFTQQDVAERIGVTQSQVSRYVRGVQRIRR
jgi:hypothetical protein